MRAKGLEIINDSIKIVTESKNLDTRLSRLDLLLQHANALLKYEQRGISITDPQPSFFIGKFGGMRDRIIVESLGKAFETASSKAAVATTITSKVNILSKVLLKIREFKAKANHPESLDALEKQVAAAIQKYQLDGYLNAARKAEFKDQKKKALDQYYESSVPSQA